MRSFLEGKIDYVQSNQSKACGHPHVRCTKIKSSIFTAQVNFRQLLVTNFEFTSSWAQTLRGQGGSPPQTPLC